MPDTKLPLQDPIHSTLKKHSRFQVIVRPCIEDGHSVWQFQTEVPDRAFSSCRQIGAAAWQSCHQLQIVKLPLPVVCLQNGAFQGCYALGQITAPGCVQFSRRVFAECCSLSIVGATSEAANVLAPGAQLGPFAFESCLALVSVTSPMARNHKSRALPDGSFCGAGIESLRLPPDFHFIGPKACENCKRLVD